VWDAVTENSDCADIPARQDPDWWPETRRAMDKPAFWWSAVGVFLANAAYSAVEGRWPVALLQILAGLWAFLAGVIIKNGRPAR
jgi:hypothetical protein